MDRNGKKPKAKHNDAPHPERSDTKAHDRDEAEIAGADARAAATKADGDERSVLANHGRKGPQQL